MECNGASGFALMYAPLVNTALQNIPAAKSGIAIGFYNLTINTMNKLHQLTSKITS